MEELPSNSCLFEQIVKRLAGLAKLIEGEVNLYVMISDC